VDLGTLAVGAQRLALTDGQAGWRGRPAGAGRRHVSVRVVGQGGRGRSCRCARRFR
jgi:hypothetical protein